MILTKQLRRNYSLTFLIIASLAVTIAYADDYRDARAELVAAYQANDYAAMQLAAQKSLLARPGFPGGLFNLALSQTLNGDHEASLQTLNVLLAKRVIFDVENLDEFAALRDLEGWSAYSSEAESLQQPLGAATVVGAYNDPKFVPEGIARDKEGRLFLGSIHKGQLIQLSAGPSLLSDRDSHWSVFGMRFHADGNLWFASAAVPQLENVGEDSGKTGLFLFDVQTGKVSKTAILPPYAPNQVLGDLLVADDNTIYTTDSLTGAVYRYYIDSNEFEALVGGGKLGSPQGLVLDASGRYLFVSDYIGGLYRVALDDGSMTKLEVANDVTDYGIDGLYRHGNELIVIQNGVRPHRVAALRLSENGLSILSTRFLASNLEYFDEPTLGTISGDDFYFVANSHWNRFDRDNGLPDGLRGPVIFRVSLPPPETHEPGR